MRASERRGSLPALAGERAIDDIKAHLARIMTFLMPCCERYIYKAPLPTTYIEREVSEWV